MLKALYDLAVYLLLALAAWVQSLSRPEPTGYLGLRTGSLEFTVEIPGLDGDASAPTAGWFTTLLDKPKA